jgi:hypothetical protein
MTLAVMLALGSLLGSSTAFAEPLLLSSPRIQEQQSSDTKPPAQAPPAQDQTPQPPETKPEPPKEAPPAAQPEQPAQEPGNAGGKEGPPAVEKPAEEAPAATRSEAAQPSSPKAKHKKPRAKPSSGPRKVIVRDGSTAEPTTQLTPGMPHDQVPHSRQTTTWLLSSTQDNLKRASARTLSSNQQATVEQIKMFIDQANSAMKEGDFQRGHNLAMKAHLLSADLLKH